MNNIETLAKFAVIAAQKEDLDSERGFLVEMFNVIRKSPSNEQ